MPLDSIIFSVLSTGLVIFMWGLCFYYWWECFCAQLLFKNFLIRLIIPLIFLSGFIVGTWIVSFLLLGSLFDSTFKELLPFLLFLLCFFIIGRILCCRFEILKKIFRIMYILFILIYGFFGLVFLLMLTKGGLMLG